MNVYRQKTIHDHYLDGEHPLIKKAALSLGGAESLDKVPFQSLDMKL
jgi:hypothetical protein